MVIFLVIDYNDLIWQSDYNGFEVGHEGRSVIGLYQLKVNPNIHFCIDTERGEVVEAFCTKYDE